MKPKNLKYFLLFFIIFINDSLKSSQTNNVGIKNKYDQLNKSTIISWEKTIGGDDNEPIKWEFFNDEKIRKQIYEQKIVNSLKTIKINSLNRSIVFDNDEVGPDVSWLFPSGFSWNKKYKFDINARGHNTSIPAPNNINFFGWNNGDAVGLVSYQFLHKDKSSFGLNFGVRSLYEGSKLGGTTKFGEGLSSGFRWDYQIDNYSGFAIGAEQLIHFDNTTDTGRNIYITSSKGWWKKDMNGNDIFPLDIATGGIGTGRMAIGNIKGLCSNLLDDGTETQAFRRLCWSPIFSLARVWNKKFSTFFEYNSRFFLLGSSLAPVKEIPIRGTFALIISDHRDNYKIHDDSELTWTFNLSLGF